MNAIKNSFALLIFSLFISVSIAQDECSPQIIVNNNIKEIKAYIFEDNVADSFLITKEYFNTKGYRTKIEIFDPIGIVRSAYSYKYKSDTLRVERITEFGGTVASRTKIYYDKKNREIKAIDFDAEGRKTGTYSKTKYNDRKLTKETKIYFSGKLRVHTKDRFNKSKKLIQSSSKVKGEWVQLLDDNGQAKNCTVTEFLNYEESNLKLIKSTLNVKEQQTILGLNGKLELVPNDILLTEKYYNTRELLEYEKQFLNNALVAVKKYKYKMFE